MNTVSFLFQVANDRRDETCSRGTVMLLMVLSQNCWAAGEKMLYLLVPAVGWLVGGGAVMLGSHWIKSWSSTQKFVALSSGEAELIAVVKMSTELIGNTGEYFRGMAKFNKMGIVKEEYLKKVLGLGYNAIVADVDTVWFEDPRPLVYGPGVGRA